MLRFIVILLLSGAASTASAAAPVILVYGDSLSAGYGLDPDQGWVRLLQRRLVDSGYEFQVINASVSGETTSGGLARLPRALLRHQPRIVVLALGGNDGLRGLPVAATRDNLQRMIRLAGRANARVLLLGIRMPPNYGPRYADAFRAVFPALARQNHVALVPFLLAGVATDPNLMQPDGLHANAAGQPRLLENVWPSLRPLLQNAATKGGGRR